MKKIHAMSISFMIATALLLGVFASEASAGATFTFPSQATLGETIDVSITIQAPVGGIPETPLEISILITNDGETIVFCEGTVSIDLSNPGQNILSSTFSCQVPIDIDLGDHSLSIETPFGTFTTPGNLVLKVLGDHDVNADGRLNISDATAIIAFIFTGGQPPLPSTSNGDLNCSGSVNIADATKLIEYIFLAGSLPCYSS